MGDRKCAVQGCNALEFRDTGICNKHRGEGIEPLGADAEKIVGAAAGVGLGLVDTAIGNPLDELYGIVRMAIFIFPFVIYYIVASFILVSIDSVDHWIFLGEKYYLTDEIFIIIESFLIFLPWLVYLYITFKKIYVEIKSRKKNNLDDNTIINKWEKITIAIIGLIIVLILSDYFFGYPIEFERGFTSSS